MLVGRDGDVIFVERRFGPGGAFEGETRHEFVIEQTQEKG
jgi:hypothetical protein